ncbi:MAG: iron-containing alcohol dehydrogenase, partial [Spirochaetales bacterium]|nr:iron-containing alcohol dehydrogenase [Spirochaetales bacterium]
MDSFIISTIPELIFGAGTIKGLPNIITARGFKNIAVITGGSSFINSVFWQDLSDSFTAAGIRYFKYRSTGETSPEKVDEIVQNLKDRNIDAVIAIGGGTVMDTGKAVSAMLCMSGSIVEYLEGVGTKEPTGDRKPLICVPTTSGTGSEVTKNAVITKIGKNGFKKSLRHKGYIPDIAVIDPELTSGCPVGLTVAAGLDAVTQLLESFVSSKSNSFTDNLALHGLKLAGRSLPRLVENGNDLDARGEMAYAAYLSGITLANAGLGVVHGAASV